MAINTANVHKILVDITDLTCPVCHEFFKKAKYLSCHHSYCEQCLEVMLLTHSKIKCPECREETAVPEGGVKMLKDNFQINRMVDAKKVVCGECQGKDPAKLFCEECNLYLCYVCDEKHKHNSPNVTSPIGKSIFNAKLCNEHNYELSFYCKDCDKLVCKHCIVQDHAGHDHNTPRSIANTYRKEINKATALLENMIVDISGTFSSIDKIKKTLGEEADKIDQHCNELIQKLMEQKEQLKQQIVLQKEKAFAVQLEKLKQLQVEVLTAKQKSETWEDSSDIEIISEQREVVRCVEHINNMQKKLNTCHFKQATSIIKFVPNEGLLPQFGWLCSTAKPYLYNCEVTNLPGQILKDNTTKFVISVKDDNGHYCYGENNQLVSAQLDDECLQVDDYKNGQYAVSFVAQRIGEAKLSIFVNGMQIKGSPFKVTVSRPYATISKPSKVINNYGSLGRPWGVSISRDGMWAITDYSNSFVYIYDSKDELVKMIGSPGMRNDQFECPFGIAFDDSNNLYVVDGGNSRIQKFDLQGNYLFQFGQEKLKNARGITVHNERVYVTDKANRCVSVFKTDGQFCSTIKSQYLRTPCGIAADINRLYVSDSDNHCIHTFTLEGNHVCKFGISVGTGWGQLYRPWDLAVDLRGNILVTDANNHHVSIFDKDGICLHCFGSNGQGDGEFNTPFGIAVSPIGTIYVCDYANKRLQIF